MYLEELLPEFRKGAKIRRKCWKDEAYIEKCAQGIIYHYIEMQEVDILANDYEFYQDPIDWDYIIRNKCLCWFWCDYEDNAQLGVLKDYNSYNEEYIMNTGHNRAGTVYNYCRPVRRDEVTFYEDKKDD